MGEGVSKQHSHEMRETRQPTSLQNEKFLNMFQKGLRAYRANIPAVDHFEISWRVRHQREEAPQSAPLGQNVNPYRP